jgi:hypothetical protein
MKRTALVLAFGLLALSALCVMTPAAEAATVDKTVNNALLPDIYVVEIPNWDGSLSLTYDSYGYTYNYGYYNHYVKGSSAETALLNVLNTTKRQQDIPLNTGTAGNTIRLYVYIYDISRTVTVSSGSLTKELKGTPEMPSQAKFAMYSGQQVKLTLPTDTKYSSFRFTSDKGGSNYLEMGLNEFSLMIPGDYILSAYVYESSFSGQAMFMTYSIKYDEPPANATEYGFVMLGVAFAAMGALVLFGRKQRV